MPNASPTASPTLASFSAHRVSEIKITRWVLSFLFFLFISDQFEQLALHGLVVVTDLAVDHLCEVGE